MSGIALAGLGKSYGPVAAVRDVTLDIRPGEFVTLLGPSGSGKTTTLRMIAGLEQPTAGTVRIGDRLVSGPGVFVPVHKRRLGMVFQSYAVWPHKTVEENVAFPLRQQGVAGDEQARRVARMLELVGLGGLAGRYPSQLSGGQQQRVSLARALVAEPEVILFDEPLSNLDAQLRESMRVLVRDLQRQLGLTAVYVTHDQAEAMALSDRIVIMHDGRLVQIGAPEDLYERPESLFVAEFVGSVNVLKLVETDAAGSRVRVGESWLRVAAVPAAPTEQVLLVRPHRLLLGEADGENVVPGTARSKMYLGDRIRYLVEAPGCGELQLDLVPDGRPVPNEGDAVRLRLPPEACVIL